MKVECENGVRWQKNFLSRTHLPVKSPTTITPPIYKEGARYPHKRTYVIDLYYHKTNMREKKNSEKTRQLLALLNAYVYIKYKRLLFCYI